MDLSANAVKFQIQSSDEKSAEFEGFSMTVRVVDRTGAWISKSDGVQQLDANTLSTTLQNIEQSGVYNLTIDVQGKNKEGQPYTRTIIRSMYIEKMNSYQFSLEGSYFKGCVGLGPKLNGIMILAIFTFYVYLMRHLESISFLNHGR